MAHGADELEWSGEASAAYVVDNFPSVASRLWGALRGGVRGPISRDFEHAFWGAGFGGGAYAGGVYLSPDVTFGIGYKNPYIIPYLSVSGLASLPLVAETVDTTVESDEPESDRPLTTFGYRLQAGFEVPIQDYAAFSVAFHGVGLMNLDGDSEGWVGVGGGFKLRL